jgi:hypothetical protein
MPDDKISYATTGGLVGCSRTGLAAWLFVLGTLALPALAGDAQSLAESQRYQQAWPPPTRVEVVLAGVAPSHIPKEQNSSSLTEKVQRLAPALKKAMADYAADFGLELQFVETSRPCQAGESRARIDIVPAPEKTARKAQRNSMGEALVWIPIKVSLDGCGSRFDVFTHDIAFLDASQNAPATGRRSALEKSFQQAVDAYARDVLDELLLVWHPAWNLPDRSSESFSLFALEPLYPQPTTGIIRNVLKNKKLDLSRQSITSITDPQPVFRWTALENLTGIGSAAAKISDIHYEFRLYAARGLVGMPNVPGELLLQQNGLTDASFQLPGSTLEPCHVYFWTVRARFHLDGFPRTTEWSALHNGLLGVVTPWEFRRGEWTLIPRNSALTYSAFKSASAVAGQQCP